jgi:cytidylate kinase
MIITIDGPAGSGKSTAARKLAARLEIAYLDTGAMYRAIAYQALQDGVDFKDTDTLTALARRTDLQLDCGPTHTRVKVNGHDVSEAIRSMEVSRYTSPVASAQAIRDLMVEKQRAIGRALGSLVSEGRDQGSVVFPNADVKFVMDAALEKRAQRRHQELQADGEDVEYHEVLENLRARDANDARQWAPLDQPGAAIRIDTSHMAIAEVVDRLVEAVKQAANPSTWNGPPNPT